MSENQKQCLWCGAVKPLEEFTVKRERLNGRAAHCKSCNRRRWKKRYHENYLARNREKERVRARERARAVSVTPKGRARRALSYAVRSGRISKPSVCERCGDSRPRHMIHGHHHDYSAPLAVEWLCQPCHAAEHASEDARAERVAPRSALVWITHLGERKTLTEWARHLGLRPGTVVQRHHKGWPVEKILAPYMGRNGRLKVAKLDAALASSAKKEKT